MPEYRIYPSLLDKYQSLLDYEQEADAPWNIVSSRSAANHPGKVPGDYILTPDEMYDRIEAELIDSINRVPHAPSRAADRGTALNEIVDCLLEHRPCTRDDMTIRCRRDTTPAVVDATIGDFAFSFDLRLCLDLRDMLRGSLCQMLVEAPLETSRGKVILYGYLDYWLRDSIIDLKTTSAYDFGKYERRWQRHVYPHCVIASGLTDGIEDFTYLTARLKEKDGVTYGEIYPETYTYRRDTSLAALTTHVEGFIDWLETNRDKITDKKIFNLN